MIILLLLLLLLLLLQQLRRLLPLLLLVADATSSRLHLAHLAEVQPDGPGAEGVVLGLASILLIGCPEAADEGVEAAPGLAEGAGAGGRGVGVAVEGTHVGMDLGLAELVEVAQELQDVGSAALGQRQRRAVVAEVLVEGVPVAALLRLVAARGLRGLRDDG